MTVGQLLGTEVVTLSGERLGSVHDVRAELGEGSLRITGLVVGGAGLAERLGIRFVRVRTDDLVPWSEVVTADLHGVVVRDRP